MSCLHRETMGIEGYQCRISGASVDADCDALVDSLCIPRQALAYAAGQREIAGLPRNHQDAIRSILRRLGPEKVKALIVAEQTQQQPAAPSAAALDSLSDAQLATLRAEATRELRDRKKAAKEKPKLLARFRVIEARLTERFQVLHAQLQVVRQAIADLEAGRLPEGKVRQRAVNLGHTHSPETRRKISAAHKARRVKP